MAAWRLAREDPEAWWLAGPGRLQIKPHKRGGEEKTRSVSKLKYGMTSKQHNGNMQRNIMKTCKCYVLITKHDREDQV